MRQHDAARFFVYYQFYAFQALSALIVLLMGLEADGHDSQAGTVWSVVVRGVATEATRTDVEALRLTCWGRRSPNRVVRIRSYEVSGRTIGLGDHRSGCQDLREST